MTNVKVLYLNKDDLKQFPKACLQEIKKKHCHLIDLNYIIKNINKYKDIKSKRAQALLDATKCNPVNLHSDRELNHTFDSSSVPRIAKIKLWLMNAKNGVTHNNTILREMKRVKLLNLVKEKIIRYRDEIVTFQQI